MLTVQDSPHTVFELEDFVVGIGPTAANRPLNYPLSLTLQAGHSVALTGPSGSGKTTLLRAAAGLINPISGSVRLEGQTPQKVGWTAYRRRVLLVDQQPVLLDTTVQENLSRPFTYRAAEGKRFDPDAAELMLQALGIDADRLDQDALSLSVGQQQRVCLVRALLLAPTIMLLDEPTSALDPEMVSTVEEYLRDRAQSDGLTMLIVTHNIEQAQRLCAESVELEPVSKARLQDATDSTIE